MEMRTDGYSAEGLMEEEVVTTRPRLLVIDDDPGPRASLRLVFGEEYEVYTADTGRNGVETVERVRPDIIILDIRMPDMSGTEVLREIRKTDRNVQVIMLTAYQSLDSAKECLRQGASDYLTKPFQVSDLRAVIDRCRQRAEEEKRRALALRSLLRENRTLEHELEQAQAAVSAGRISAGVVHEISTPLSIISAYAELLEKEIEQTPTMEDDLLELARARLSVMRREVERCRGIARQLLDFARPDGGDPELYDVRKPVDQAVGLIWAHPSSRGISIDLSLPDEEIRIYGRDSDLVHLLVNLGVNAVQACSEGGGGSVRFEVARVDRVDAERGDEAGGSFRWIPLEGFDGTQPHVVLTVEDTGCGISPENMARILRTNFSTKDHGEGTGLGLFICSRILSRYRGAMRFRSRLGEGTRIDCYLRDSGYPSGEAQSETSDS